MSAAAKAPPIIDFAPFYGKDATARQKVVDQIREACLDKGFFQIINTPIPPSLQESVFEQAKKFFALPLEEKLKIDKDLNDYHRGYEVLRSQVFEEGGRPDLKEGIYIGEDLPPNHPYVKSKKFNCGPNLYPESIDDPEQFKKVTDTYFHTMLKMSQDILRVLALTLELPETWFEEFTKGGIGILRMLHYPSQAVDSDALERGIGAHTDFGAVTLLMQDGTGGLQVWDKETDSWIDVVPTKGAYVINLGNLMMRWCNDKYKSNLHRVINKSGKERYSVPFFFTGNPDYLVKCLPGCDDGGVEKYPPVVVQDYIKERYSDTYGKAATYNSVLKQGETGGEK